MGYNVPFFSIDDIKPRQLQQPEASADKQLCTAYLNSHEFKVSGLRDLCHRLPDPGQMILLWTLKQFNAFTFIPYIIQNAGTIHELAISTYSISTKGIDAIMLMVDRGQIGHVHISISDSVKFRIPRVVDHLNSLVTARPDKISLLYGWNHSKITLMKTDKGFYIVEGSGNFTENAQHEQYIFMNSEQIYNFRKECMDGIHN